MTEAKEQVKPFAGVLREVRKGNLHSELSDALQEVTTAVIEHSKPGEIALKLKIKPTGEEAATVMIEDAVTTKVPQPTRPQSMFFADDEGNLNRRDPRQAELPVQAVEGGGEPATASKEAASA